jgi:tetratricopeptide (TPR) repeat protein
LASLERDRVPSPRPIPAREIPLIDRLEEMKLLKEAVDRAIQGEGGLVFLYGEAGIGKTRLARELGAYARLRGMQVLYGRCPALFRMDGVPPYVLWNEVIRDYLQVCTPGQLYKVVGYYPSEVCKLVPEVRQKLGAIPQSLPINPEHERDRLFEAVSQFIINISREAPLLIVLDDLQWTDQSSLLLLHYLTRGIQRESLLLLGDYRDTDVDERHPLSPVLTELNRERLSQSVQLKRMSLNETSEMIKQILEQEDVPTEFCKLVYEKTRGNPFFAEEVIKSLKEEEAIYREENKWKIREISRIEFPKTVKSVIKARISRLDDECQNVLTTASFVGNDFTFEALSGATGIEEDKLLELLEKMLKTGLVKEKLIRGEGIFSFADVIVRDVVHEEVSLLRHKKLHNTVGCALEKVYAKDPDEHLGELAYHFLEGGDKEKALDYFLKAGERAAKIYANGEAVSYLQSALDLVEDKEDERRKKACLLEKLGDVKKLIGDYEASTEYWNDALLSRKQLDEKETAAMLHRKMANVFWNNLGNREKAGEHHQKASEILEAEAESVELARLYEDKAEMISMGATGNMKEALSWAEKAVDIAKKLNAYEVIARSYACLGEISMWLGDTKKAVECMEKALKIALDNGATDTALWVYNDAGAIPAEEHEKILEHLEKGFELAKRVGDISWQTWIGTNLASTYMGMGNMNRAVLLLQESVASDRKAGNITHLSMSLDFLGSTYQILGEWDKSEQYYQEALSISQKLDDFQAIMGGQGFLGLFHFDKGEYVRAKEYYEKMYAAAERHGAKSSQMGVSHFVIWAYLELGEIEKAENMLGTLREYALETKNRDRIAFADVLTAMLLRSQRKWEESIEYFEKGLQEFEALSARRWNVYWFARMVLSEYARLYLERDQEGDRKKAHSLLDQALEIFQKIGAKKDVEKAEAKLIYIETGQAASMPKPVGHVATGYADLDKLLYGGIPPNYAVALTAPSCDERDSLVKDFLETGAKNGEVTFYITLSLGPAKALAEEFQSNFHLFVCNPQADAIVREASNIFKLKGVENLTDISIALTSAIRKLDPSLKGLRRICIDLVSDVLLQHHAVQTRRWLTALIAELKSTGFTTLAVIDPRMHPSEELYAILGLFEGEVSIHEKEAEKGPARYLKIKKMSNQKYLDGELLLRSTRVLE